MKAEDYIRKEIPTMVGDNHVASMKLTTLIALLNGYAQLEAETKGNKISLSPVLADSCQHEWFYNRSVNVNEIYKCRRCGEERVGNFR